MTTCALGEIFEIARGGSPRPIDQFITEDDDGINWILIGDATEGSKYIEKTKKKIKPSGISRSRTVKSGDFLLTNSMSFGRPYIMKTDGCIHDGWLSLSPKMKNIDPNYFYYLLGSPAMYSQFAKLAAGATVKNLNIDLVSGVHVAVPPLEEQRRIAAILDQADALRRKRSNSLRMIAGLAQAIFVEMFGNPVTNSENWRSAELSEVVVGKYGVKAGPFGSSLKKEEYVSRGYRVYGQEQVIAGRFDIGDYFIDEKKYRQLETCAVSPGDILVSLVGSFGKVLVVPEGIDPGIINPRLLKITPDGNVITSSYLASLLSMPMVQKKLAGDAHGGTMGILNAGILKKLKVILPELESQQEFQRRLAISSQIIHANESSATYLAALFGTLQNRLLGVDFENTQKRSPSLRAAE